DTQPGEAKDRDELRNEEEMLHRNAPDAVADGPRRQGLGRVLGMDHQPGAVSVGGGGSAGRGVETDQLEPAPLGAAPVALAEGLGRETGEVRISVRLDLDLD